MLNRNKSSLAPTLTVSKTAKVHNSILILPKISLVMSPNFQQSSSHLLDSGGNSALIGGGSGGDRGKRANSTDSLNDLTDHFDSLFNFHSPPFFVPQSAPPFHLSAPPTAAANNNGLNQQLNYNSRQSIYGRPHHKVNQPSFFSLKLFLGGLPANLTTS